jgi:arylsulfatase A-like enzyme
MAADGFTQPSHVGSTGIFRGKKAQTYEGGHRVPFIVYWNKRIKPSSNDQLISSLDLWPTIANILQQPMPAAVVFDGESVWNTITNKNSKTHQPVYYVNDGRVEAVRNGDWKYRKTIKDGQQVEELFNLKTDPSEKNNVFNLQPEITTSMAALLSQYPK